MNRIFRLVLSVSVLVFSTKAYSESINFRGSLGFQLKNLTFDQEYSTDGISLNEAEFTATLPVLTASVTGIYQKFFLTLKIEKSFSATTTTDETDRSRPNEISANLIALEGSNLEVERQDVSVTFGYNLWRSLNLFVGYLDGATKLTPHPFCANPAEGCTRLNRAYQQFIVGDFFPEENIPEYEQNYSEQGFYIGSSYSWIFEDAGALSFSAAYASMDGEYEDNASDPVFFFDESLGRERNVWDNSLTQFRYEGDSSGISLGLTWSGALGEKSEYFFDARLQQYSMEGTDVTGQAILQNVDLETEETMTSFTAGLRIYL